LVLQLKPDEQLCFEAGRFIGVFQVALKIIDESDDLDPEAGTSTTGPGDTR
jgi:hypothetical protein